jgi:hypothetical protein
VHDRKDINPPTNERKMETAKLKSDSGLNYDQKYDIAKTRRIRGSKDCVESSYRIFNDLVNKAHERRLEQMEDKNQEADFMEFKYDPKTCILVVTLEDKTEIAATLDSGSTYSLISRETINKSESLRKTKTKKNRNRQTPENRGRSYNDNGRDH